MPKIIGIDPGLADTGVGIVWGRGACVEGYAFGVVHTQKTDSLPTRLELIFTRLSSVIEKETPDLMVVEEIFSLPRYPASAIGLGKVVGVVLLAGGQAGVPVREVPVREAKQVLTGNGNASKKQLERSVRRTLQRQTPITPDHASDALGLALIGLFRFGTLSVTRTK
jgi:crossover junction endodeoxyribonuclease RuvC